VVDVNRIPPPPGWYDDPWPGDGIRWWDGSRWTEHTQRRDAVWPTTWAPAGGDGRGRLGRGWCTLSRWLQAVLWTALVLSLAEQGGAWWLLVLARRWHADPATFDHDASTNSTDLIAVMLTLRVLVLVAGAVLFICWLVQAHRSDRMDRTRARHPSGWAIWGWFVPVLWFWYPLVMVSETAGTTPTCATGRSRSS
jgi:hypothetical protein